MVLGRLALIAILHLPALSQFPVNPNTEDVPSSDEKHESTIFNHSQTSRFWLSGQINIILQWHPSFHAKYSGANSLRAEGENATSRVLTLDTGIQLTKTTEILVDVESAGGRGISDALGLAGFTNLDVVRNPTLGSTPYLARAMLRKLIPLTDESIESERGPIVDLQPKCSSNRVEVRIAMQPECSRT